MICEVTNSACSCLWGRTRVTIPGISTSCSSNLKPEFPCPGRVSLLNEYSCKDKRNSCSPKVYSWILVNLDEALEENKTQILIMKSLECHETCCTGLFSVVGVAGVAILIPCNATSDTTEQRILLCSDLF